MRVERWRKTLKWEDSQLCRILSLRNELAEGCRIERNVYSGPAARRRQLQTSHHTQHIMKTGQLSACMPLRQPKQTNKQTNFEAQALPQLTLTTVNPMQIINLLKVQPQHPKQATMNMSGLRTVLV